MNNNNKSGRSAAIFTIVVGIFFVLAGIIIKVPSDELSTYSFMADECSVIEEYVGGDAYNYIIGAAIVSGHITGAEIQKAIFISIGFLLICIGSIVVSISPTTKCGNTSKPSPSDIEKTNTNTTPDNEEMAQNIENDVPDKLQEWKDTQILKAKVALEEGRITEEKYTNYVAKVTACKRIPEKK